jgi:ABC-type polysaccharide/polyol phosphate transport system ATPase subunit
MNNTVIEVDGLWKNFRMYHERNRYIKAAMLRGRRARYDEFWALRDISVSVQDGATIGFIGANGSGKSTFLKCLTGIYQPDRGSLRVHGTVAALLELGAGFSPELTGRENIFLNGSILGMSRADIKTKLDQIVEFAGIGEFIDSPVKNYSSGMTVRLGFSIAAHVEPRILLIDEVLSVGDQSFQRRSSEKIEQFRREGRTIVVVSHSLGVVEQLCSETVWLDKGAMRMRGPSAEVIAAYTGGSYQMHQREGDGLHEQWGTGDAQIMSMTVTDLAGQPVEVVETGAALRVTLQLNAHLRVENPIVRLSIDTLQGQHVWASSTQHGQARLRMLDGPATTVIEIPSLPLLDGQYTISAAILDSTGTTELDHHRNWKRLDVHGRGIHDSGIVHIPATWSMRRD